MKTSTILSSPVTSNNPNFYRDMAKGMWLAAKQESPVDKHLIDIIINETFTTGGKETMNENIKNEQNGMMLYAINFYGDDVQVIEKDETFYVTMKPLCENIGLDWESQRQMISRDTVLNSVACIIQATGNDGKTYEMLSLPLQYLNGWLFKVNPERYEGALREKLISYQKECYEILFKHFIVKNTEPPRPSIKSKIQTIYELLPETMEVAKLLGVSEERLMDSAVHALEVQTGYDLKEMFKLNLGEAPVKAYKEFFNTLCDKGDDLKTNIADLFTKYVDFCFSNDYLAGRYQMFKLYLGLYGEATVYQKSARGIAFKRGR